MTDKDIVIVAFSFIAFYAFFQFIDERWTRHRVRAIVSKIMDEVKERGLN